MVGALVDLLKMLQGAFGNTRLEREASSKRFFDHVILESFETLRLIHDDYQGTMSTLARYLSAQSCPPQELIEWLRDSGMKYRSERDALWTVGAELISIDFTALAPGKRAEGLESACKAYVRSIVNYGEVAMSHTNLSFYRDYEQQLNSLSYALQREAGDQSDRAGGVIDIFYRSDFVQDMNTTLLRLADRDLPDKWQAVVGAFRRVRSTLGHPD
jgi:hypothetical protein